MPNTVTVNESFVFPNGVYIFKRDGTQIDPRSIEGRTISDIYAQQAAVKKLNTQEKLDWIKTTYPREPVKQQELRIKLGV